MAGRPGTLPWNMATFTGANPVTTLSDNFNFLNNQINDSGAGFTTFALDTGTPNNLIVTLASAPLAYEAGMMLCVSPANINTGPSVINVNSLGNQSIVTSGGVALNGGELSHGVTSTLVYDGTNFRIVGNCPLGLALGLTSAATFNCLGYTSVCLRLGWTSGPSTESVTLVNLCQGVPIILVVTNFTGSALTFTIFGNNSAGVATSSISACTAGSVNGSPLIDMRLTGVSIAAGNTMIFTGSLLTPTFLFFSK